MKHLQFQSKELEIYTEQLEKVLQRYIQRIQWLLSGIGVHLFFYKAQLIHRIFLSTVSNRINLNINLDLKY